MPTFKYLIRTPEGIRKEGELDAPNITEASETLRKDGALVVKVVEKDTSFDFLGAFIERYHAAVNRWKARVPLNTIVFFTRQLATMFSAGLTIERALHFLGAEEKHKKFRKIVKGVESDIKKGLLLSDSLERHPGVFNNLFISLVRAGEVSGKLSDTLEELAIYMEKVEDPRRKVKSALYYPVFIMIFLVLMLLFSFTVIIPKFAEIYDQLGSELPFYTRVMTNVAYWIKENLLFVIFVVVVSWVFTWLFTLSDFGRLMRDNLMLKLPVFGLLIRQNILSKFTKTFGILLSAGVSVLEGMKLTSKVVENRVYELAVEQAAYDIENGVAISRALKDTEVFPPIMIQLVSTGEETGEIDNLTLKASDFYTKQVDATIDRLTSILEPLLLFFVAAVIGVIVIATYLPIFQVGDALAQ